MHIYWIQEKILMYYFFFSSQKNVTSQEPVSDENSKSKWNNQREVLLLQTVINYRIEFKFPNLKKKKNELSH